MLKAILLDFDGLVIDTEVVWYGIFRDWFKVNTSYDLSIQEFLVCVGSTSQALFDKLKMEQNIIVDTDKFAKDTYEHFIELSNSLPANEGVEDFIKSLKSMNLVLSLATSSRKQKPINHLTRLGLIQYFDQIITADDVLRVKPFPDLFLKAIEVLGVKKDEALIVEDSFNGLQAGIEANIRVMVIPNAVTKHSKFKGYYKKEESLALTSIKVLCEEW